ncbi:MAG TPA: lipoyl(octanoyl) transferase LipB [Hellea balneolensis]|uniref:Octanoyltransferase n=1 Tax=Hellea balneolensis TaxID=287478 RepID=A0A7C3G4V3_9PROT|nr:lipoyl(octanoyl) transferase LipB [Hellea balneolensis]
MTTPRPLFQDTPCEWIRSLNPVPYPRAVAHMEERVAAIAAGAAPEQIWCLEHPALYTAGTSADSRDLIDPDFLPVFKTGRGGQYTYHGPGQLVVYFMLDLKKRGRDVRAFVAGLEGLIMDTLADFGVNGGRREGRIGVWVMLDDGHGNIKEAKIAALGVRVRKWVSYHGISINVHPDLSHFDGIVPCGISEHGVTSLRALGIDASLDEVEARLHTHFKTHFGPTTT